MTRKTATKSARPEKIIQPNGKGALYAGGVPGNKGGTGRPPNEFKDWCASLLADETAREEVQRIIRNGDHRAFAAMFKELADRAHGRVSQPLEHGLTTTLEDLLTASRKV